MNYLSKYLLTISEVGEPLRRLTSVKSEWNSNRMYQELHFKATGLIMKDACMIVYDEKEMLYIETNGFGVGLDAGLLQVRDGMNCTKDTTPDNSLLRSIAFVSGSLSNAETCYSNTERDAPVILHGFQRFHHDCFAREVHIITKTNNWYQYLGKELAPL